MHGTSGLFIGGNVFAASRGVEDKVERDAEQAPPEQQATAAPATDNTTQHAEEHAITYPSRLIYYLNEDSESTYHDLNTRAKNQATSDQVSSYSKSCCLDCKLVDLE